MIRIKTRIIAVFGVCAAVAHACGATIEYTVTDLGTLGGPTSVATAISQNGIIVGNSELYVSGNSGVVRENHPCIFQAGGQIQDLGLLDPVNGISGQATSVNCNGQVVGSSDSPGTDWPANAFLYNAGGPLIDLGTLGGQESFAYGINESGQIAGEAQTASGAWHGVLWSVGGATVDLGSGFIATAINNEGLIGGVSTQTLHAAIYNMSTGSITDIGTLGGAQSQVNGMSDRGLAVGLAETPITSHGFLYNVKTGVLTDLGNLASPGWYSDASGVNGLGQVVGGYSLDATSAETAAFIYTQAGGMQNLNDLINPSSGWDLTGCGGINDAGQIVGSGFSPQGEFHAFLLTPVVPEPSTLWLFCAAILGVVAIQAGARLLRRHRHDNL